jgi:hypothetical protein
VAKLKNTSGFYAKLCTLGKINFLEPVRSPIVKAKSAFPSVLIAAEMLRRLGSVTALAAMGKL